MTEHNGGLLTEADLLRALIRITLDHDVWPLDRLREWGKRLKDLEEDKND